MKIFRLPDLGEGLPDAVIREWYVKVGDAVIVDQPLVAMETAKALVDVPSPFTGKIEQLYGNPSDTIETGHPLIGFEGESLEAEKLNEATTVVGTIEKGEKVLHEAAEGISLSKSPQSARIKATPAVRLLAKQLGVDLSTLTPKTTLITANEVKEAAQKKDNLLERPLLNSEFISLSQFPARRAMAESIAQSRDRVVPVCLVEEADLYTWQKRQEKKNDITIRLIRAIEAACEAVPIMNAHFDDTAMAYKLNASINIGLAVDTPEGLYVPVLKNSSQRTKAELREEINQFKKQAQERSFKPEDLRGATIMLSNFGIFTGRFATPILLPPLVTIIAVGRCRQEVVAYKGKAVIHPIMPLSVTSDHRLITGGEIARFLKALICSLEQPVV